jgi:beta-glucosidase
MPQVYINNVRDLVKEGKLAMSTVDERVRDVLRVKFRLGLFNSPLIADTRLADKIVHTAKDDSMELQLDRESLVLLKNKEGLLPLNKSRIKNHSGYRAAGS